MKNFHYDVPVFANVRFDITKEEMMEYAGCTEEEFDKLSRNEINKILHFIGKEYLESEDAVKQITQRWEYADFDQWFITEVTH